MNRKVFQGCLLPLGLLRQRTAALLVGALACCAPAFCGPIHEAARDGDIKKVEELLKADPALVSSKDEKYGQTPLHVAAFNNHADIAKLLIEDHADVNARANNGSTPLHLAAAKGNKEIVELLIDNHADVNALDKDGWSPAHSASTFDHMDIVELLGTHGGKEIPAPKEDYKNRNSTPATKAAPKETGKDGNFIAYDNGTVLDTKTNLMWGSGDNGGALSWPGAKTYAGTARTGGYSDWRLPTLAELKELYNAAKTRRSYCPSAVDELGREANEVHLTETIHLTCTRAWASDEPDAKTGNATVFDFHSGSAAARPADKDFIDTASRVLLVRQATPPAATTAAGAAAPAGQAAPATPAKP